MAVLLSQELNSFEDRSVVDSIEQKNKNKELNEGFINNENFTEDHESLYYGEETDESLKNRKCCFDNKVNKETYSFHCFTGPKDVFSEFPIDLCSEKGLSTFRTQESWDLPVGPVPWDDNEKPIVRLLNYADLKLTPDEEKGLLTDRIVSACSSYLHKSPGNKCQVLAKVSLSYKNLNNIGILGCHRFLQYIDLSWNNLTDLSPLGCIPYLMYLDVSHNLLEDVLRFRPPLNLTYVNYSFNQVWRIDDLSDFWTLCYLDLSHNKISKIHGFHNLRYLRYLDLSHNNIERLENLNDLRITDLNLEYNLISKFEMDSGLGLGTMPNLTNVYLNNNLISKLEFLKNVSHLKKLELQGNNISELVELTHMKGLKNLRHLDLSGNIVSKQKPYRSLVLNLLQELKFLDQTEVEISERVAACKIKKFDIQLESAKQYSRMLLLEQLNDVSLDLGVLPMDQAPHPFVILVGPSASSKKFITSYLGDKYSKKIYVAKLHTTRPISDTEKEILQETSRDKFEEMIKSGMFLCVYENIGHYYGFSREEFGIAVEKRKLCLTSMDIIGALTVLSFNMRPFLILTIPESKEEHLKRLKLIYGPVLHKLGVAYIANRRFVNSRHSNVKMVKNIVKQIVKDVLNGVNLRITTIPKDNELIFKNLESSSKEQNKSTEHSDSASLNSYDSSFQKGSKISSNLDQSQPYYNSSEHYFPCTPSKCGFQTCQNLRQRQKDEESSTMSENTRRFSTLEDEMNEEETLTSYSANDPPPFKLELFSSEGSCCGESEPFANWSTPFIDWSEINLDELELEQAAEILCQKYIENVMSTRDVYLNIHLENPGLFSLCVFTDDNKKAIKTLVKFLKEICRSTSDRKPTFDADNDIVYQAFIPRKLDYLKEILYANNNSFASSKNFLDIPSAEMSPSECMEMKKPENSWKK